MGWVFGAVGASVKLVFGNDENGKLGCLHMKLHSQIDARFTAQPGAALL